MAHRVAPQAEADLDGLWYYVAKESGSIEIADRLIDSITERFPLLSRNPRLGRRRDEELRPGLRSFPSTEAPAHPWCGSISAPSAPARC